MHPLLLLTASHVYDTQVLHSNPGIHWLQSPKVGQSKQAHHVLPVAIVYVYHQEVLAPVDDLPITAQQSDVSQLLWSEGCKHADLFMMLSDTVS